MKTRFQAQDKAILTDRLDSASTLEKEDEVPKSVRFEVRKEEPNHPKIS